MHHPQTHSIPTPSLHHAYLHQHILLPLPKKNAPNKLQKKHFTKKCKNKSCRDALPPKNTSPKTNETSDNAHHNACIDYPHITAQCIYRVATILTSFNHTHHNLYHAPILNCTFNTSFNEHKHPQSSSTMTPRLHPTTTLTSLSTIIMHFTKHVTLHYNQPKPLQEQYSHQNALSSTVHHSQAQTKLRNSSQYHTATYTHNKHNPHQPLYNTLDNTQCTLYQTRPHRPPLQRTCTHKHLTIHSQIFITLKQA